MRIVGEKKINARTGSRSLGLEIKSLSLYQLSYPGVLKN
jgi:hypothetical protein